MTNTTTQYFNPASDRQMTIALLVLLIGQLIVIPLILALLNAPSQAILILIALIFAGNFANLYLLTFMFWKPLEKRWPAQPPRPDPVSRHFQTFWFGPLRQFNFILHAAADEQHIHITPIAPMRWLGVRTISLPLDDMHHLRPHPLPWLLTCTLHNKWIAGPRWCLSLAHPE